MSRDDLLALHQAVQMLVAAYDDVQQSLVDFAKTNEDDMDCEVCEYDCAWIRADEARPGSDDEKVVVKTDTGAMFFASTINGKFMKNVKYWYPLPK